MFVRRAIHAAGHRYRLYCKGLPGKPDLIFPRYRLAVFIHGCFWHGHDCPRGARVPATNQTYWVTKIEKNKLRDKDVRAKLKAVGWNSRVIWECELKKGLASLLKHLDAGRRRGIVS
jgi:DNA mismatch endonuclease, patch repair protein